MKAEELTPLQRIEILEDVLRKLESGDNVGGLCLKIEISAYRLFRVGDKAKNIISLLTLENANKVTDINAGVIEGGYWWICLRIYDFKNRIKFVKWMIEQEKEFLK